LLPRALFWNIDEASAQLSWTPGVGMTEQRRARRHVLAPARSGSLLFLSANTPRRTAALLPVRAWQQR